MNERKGIYINNNNFRRKTTLPHQHLFTQPVYQPNGITRIETYRIHEEICVEVL